VKSRIMNNYIFKAYKELFFTKYVFENKELEKRHKRLINPFAILAILALPLLIANVIIGAEADALGFLGMFVMAWSLAFWGMMQALELADKIVRKQ